MFEPAGAVSQALDRRHAERIEQRQMQVGERRAGRVAQMATAFLRPGSAAGQEQGQVLRGVQVGVGHPGAVDDGHAIEQRRVAIGHSPQPIEVVREER